MAVLVVPRLTAIHRLVLWESTWSTLEVPRDKHHEAPIFDLFDAMVWVAAGFGYLVLIEVLVETVDGLFRSVIPACVEHLLTILLRPQREDLRHDGLRQIVGVTNMRPVAYTSPPSARLKTPQDGPGRPTKLPCFAVVLDAI